MNVVGMLLLTTSARALRPAARRLGSRCFHYRSGGKSSAGTAAAAVGCFAASAAYALGDEPQNEEHDWAGVLDTATTGAAALRRRVPEGDGRGIVVAILDTGVDPAAPGLQTTTTGAPKMLDVLDATGAGDVDLNATATPDADGWLTNPATGRKLRVDVSTWAVDGTKCAPPKDGVYRVGGKRTASLFPAPMLRRLKGEAKRFDDEAYAPLRAALAAAATESDEAAARLVAFDAARKALTPTDASVAPLLDVISWRDGLSGAWRCVAVDGARESDLVAHPPHVLGDFGAATAAGEASSRWVCFGEADMQLTLSASSPDAFSEAHTCSLVVAGGDHATHVAGIVGAYNGKDRDDGVAPGCQLVSIKIGDSRVGTMETGSSLRRALVAARRLKVDVVNLSYGEAARLCDTGRFAELSERLVRGHADHGAVLISSAGNNGPALTTVGAPGASVDALISVGAYVNGNMCGDLYGMRAPATNAGGPESATHGGVMYSFSSRGPATDGGCGVHIAAPGGAVTSVPKYSLQPQRLMHGTSMAAPNAAGAVACLLSAAKASGLKPAPDAVKRSLEATCQALPGVASTDQGRGLVDVDTALASLGAIGEDLDVRFEVRVPARAAGAGAPGARGIYLRERWETCGPREVAVTVVPKFQGDDEVSAERKGLFRRDVRLEATVPWIEVGKGVIVTRGGKAFTLRVDPEGAGPEGAGPFCGEVLGFDDAVPDAPPLFRVPVTVVRPLAVQGDAVELTLPPSFSAGDIARNFVAPPAGAASATIEVTCAGDGLGRRIVHVSTVQLHPQEAMESGWSKRRAYVHDGESCVYDAGRVVPGTCMEVCVAQDWSSLEGAQLSANVKFQPGCSTIETVALRGTRSVTSIPLEAPAWARGPVVASPKLKLTRWRRALRPTTSSVTPLEGARDAWPAGAAAAQPAYALKLEYEFAAPKAGATAGGTRFLFAGDECVYDAPFDGAFAEVTEKATGKIIGSRDARVSGKIGPLKPGGSYVVNFLIQHEDEKALEKLRDAECWLDSELSKAIDVPVFGTAQAAYARDNSSGFKDVRLAPGDKKVAFAAPPDESKLPAEALAGDLLTGSAGLCRSAANTEGPSRRPAVGLTYSVPPRSNKTAKKAAKAKEVSAKAAPDAPKAGRARELLGAAAVALDDAAAIALADKAAANYVAELKKGSLDDASSDALRRAVVAYDANRTAACASAALSRAAAGAAPGWNGKNGTAPIANATAAAGVAAAAADVMSVLDVDAIKDSRATRDRDDTSFGNDTAAKDATSALRKRAKEDYAALCMAKRWSAEAALATDAAAFETAMRTLDEWVDTAKSTVSDARLRAKRFEARGEPGLAVRDLGVWLDADAKKKSGGAVTADVAALRELRRDLMAGLGWERLAAAETKKILDDFPNCSGASS